MPSLMAHSPTAWATLACVVSIETGAAIAHEMLSIFIAGSVMPIPASNVLISAAETDGGEGRFGSLGGRCCWRGSDSGGDIPRIDSGKAHSGSLGNCDSTTVWPRNSHGT